MSGLVMGLILDRYPRTDHTGLIIALVLGDAADQDGSNVRPSVRRIAKLARVSERTVQYHIQQFLNEDLLILVELGGGRNRPSEYRINMRWLATQPSILDSLKKGAPPASFPIPCKNDAPVSAPILNEGVQILRNQDCTQPLPVIKNPPTPPNDSAKVQNIRGDREKELWNAKLPSYMENGRDALVAAALKHNRSADDVTAACLLAVAVPKVRDPVALAISKLKDKHWTKPPNKPIQASVPVEQDTLKVTSKDDAKLHIEKLYAIQK